MKATITKKNHNGKIAGNRKEKHFQSQLMLVAYDGEIKTPVEARFYGTNSRNYCCIWVQDSKSQTYTSGGGYAGGYGYHRASAALQAALDDAGIVLNEAVDGRGDGVMEEAVTAIGHALGYADTPLRIIHAHA